MRTAYVINAAIGRGGAYMAYHIGRLLAREFGYRLVDVQTMPPKDRIFTYDTPMESMPLARMEAQIQADDMLICNPSFSQHMFGLRLPGKKLMYVQDFRTFAFLDAHFDCYISVSSVVQEYLRSVYGLESSVIPPFIDTAGCAPLPWEQRPAQELLIYCKVMNPEHAYTLKLLESYLPDSYQSRLLQSYTMPHTAFLQRLGAVRYVLNLSIAEGFGLVPLEAFALGTLVLGLDGAAGRDFMRYGENGYAVPFRAYKDWLKELPALLQLPHPASVLTAAAETAREYGYAQFRTRWLPVLETLSHGH